MTTMIDFPDLDAAIDAEAWQWLQEAARHLRRQRQEAGQ